MSILSLCLMHELCVCNLLYVLVTRTNELQVKECDERLLAIHVTHSISRTPRSLEEFNHWKGSQILHMQSLLMFARL